MTYEVVMPYHLHMPSYFLGTFTEYPYIFCLYQFSTMGLYFGTRSFMMHQPIR